MATHFLDQVNGILKRLPYDMVIGGGGGYVSIRGGASMQGAVLTTDFGLSMTYDGISRLTLGVPESYKGSLCGLCGNYDG